MFVCFFIKIVFYSISIVILHKHIFYSIYKKNNYLFYNINLKIKYILTINNENG
jgi:hypothetical protein